MTTRLKSISERLAKEYGIHLSESKEFQSLHHEEQRLIRQYVYDILWSYSDIK